MALFGKHASNACVHCVKEKCVNAKIHEITVFLQSCANFVFVGKSIFSTQSFDGTGIGLVGKMDDYDDYNVKTSAMAEGVIEGTAADYIVKPTSPEFKYSRFDAKTPNECKPRDSKLLSGRKIRVPGNSVVGASD